MDGINLIRFLNEQNLEMMVTLGLYFLSPEILPDGAQGIYLCHPDGTQVLTQLFFFLMKIIFFC